MKLQLPSDKSFGITMSLLLTAAAGYARFAEYPETIWLVLSAPAFLTISLGAPILLRPLNRLLMGLGYTLSLVVNPLVLGASFFPSSHRSDS